MRKKKKSNKTKSVVIKEPLVRLTGNFIPALILNQFIYWSERMYDTDDYIEEENERIKQQQQSTLQGQTIDILTLADSYQLLISQFSSFVGGFVQTPKS